MDIDGIAESEPQHDDDDVRTSIEAAWNEVEAQSATPDAVAPPKEETTAETSERARDEAGRFAKANEKALGDADKVIADAQAKVDSPPVEGVAQDATKPSVAGPPPGWSIASKAEFEKLPQAVKDDIAKRETEINNGFAKLGEYRGLDPYIETARNNGTTVTEALDRYMAAEKSLADDFVGGIRGLCQMYQVHPAQLAQALGVEQQQGGYQQPQQQQYDPMHPVMNELSALKQSLRQIQNERQANEDEAISRQVEAFASDPKNKYFENVRGEMGRLLSIYPNATLESLYEQAMLLNPETRSILEREKVEMALQERQRVADQNRRARQSLPTGMPTGIGSSNPKSDSIRGAIEAAWQEATV
jgi:hypothetical protein